MMLHYFNTNPYVYETGRSHWVISVSYDNASSSDIGGLLVCDPYTRNTSATNTSWSLSDSKSYNMNGVSIFYYGYATTSAA